MVWRKSRHCPTSECANDGRILSLANGIGKDALHALLLLWLGRLAPHGVARLVVGRNLGADSLQRWLIAQGYQCERTASARGFRVFEVRPLACEPVFD